MFEEKKDYKKEKDRQIKIMNNMKYEIKIMRD